MKPAILLISANTERFPEPVFPVGLAYLANALERRGASVAIFDAGIENNPKKSLRAALASFRPDAVGISLRNVDNAAYPHTRSYLPWYRELTETVRDATEAPVVLGGAALSIFPEELRAATGATFAVAGDGEAGVDVFFGRQPSSSVRGSRLERLDDVMFPRTMGKIFPGFARYRTIGIQTARGCPHRCIYCTYPVLEGARFRPRPADIVAEEIALLNKEWGAKEFFIVDAAFNADDDHMERVLRAIISRRLKIRFSCYLQPRASTAPLFPLLKQAGCIAVDFGTDTGSPAMLQALGKSFTVEDIRTVSNAAAAAHIDCCHSLIFGGPGETSETIGETVALLDMLAPAAVVAMTGMRIYPGTPLAARAIAQGIVKDGRSLLTPAFYDENARLDALVREVAAIAARRKNWFLPGGRNWSASLWPALLRLVYRRGPLWRALKR